ncbi:hypothetical protein Droror1_Dr00013369 [Drosera rotundifolia]
MERVELSEAVGTTLIFTTGCEIRCELDSDGLSVPVRHIRPNLPLLPPRQQPPPNSLLPSTQLSSPSSSLLHPSASPAATKVPPPLSFPTKNHNHYYHQPPTSTTRGTAAGQRCLVWFQILPRLFSSATPSSPSLPRAKESSSASPYRLRLSPSSPPLPIASAVPIIAVSAIQTTQIGNKQRRRSRGLFNIGVLPVRCFSSIEETLSRELTSFESPDADDIFREPLVVIATGTGSSKISLAYQ